MKVMITLNQIKKCSPCPSGWKKLKAAKVGINDDEEFPLSDILVTNNLSDCLWALRCTPEALSPLWRKFAVWSAKQVEHLMEDERIKKALDVAWRHSNGKATDGELTSAVNTVDTTGAYTTATTASAHAAAAYAVYAAGDDPDVVYAASAATSARAAAYAAAYAVYADVGHEQSEKLKQILDSGEWVE